MTRDDIIRMAREADINLSTIEYYQRELEHFAALVAAHTLSNINPSSFMSYQEGFEAGAAAEREACAKVADAEAEESVDCCYSLAVRVSSAIRARGETK